MPNPELGGEKPVRVCDYCYEQHTQGMGQAPLVQNQNVQSLQPAKKGKGRCRKQDVNVVEIGAEIPNPIPGVEETPILPLAATLAAARVSFAP